MGEKQEWGGHVADGVSSALSLWGMCMDVRVGPYRRLSAKELMLSNYDVGEDS